ncbi:S9 family peptidase [Fructobacillus tropaeoli]|uniref:S9 family peptidase n=1 Tax=Fructobacillus tropaeoli TaxID=709323 RepID=UPI002D837AEC|nr:Dipeptidyl aminopeptidase/acylaminoacyl peptidase (DAP2) [Fructobacillus tropaeoli]
MDEVSITDLYHIKSLSQPWAAGSLTFFVENGLSQENNDYTANIYSVDQHHHVKQYTNEGLNLQPLVVDDYLYFRKQDENQHFQLMKMPINGGVAEQVTAGDSIAQVKLAPDKQVLFFKTVQTPVKNDDELTTRHVHKVQNRADGIGWIPTDNHYDLVRFDLKSQTATTIWTGTEDFSLEDISPDQNQVLFLAAEHPDWTSKFDESLAVYLYDIDKQEKIWLTKSFPDGVFSDAHFSPNGQQVTVIGSDYSHYSATVNQLYLYDLTDMHVQNITGNDDLDVGYEHSIGSDIIQNRSGISGAWLTNSQYLFQAYDHGHSQLHIWDGEKTLLVTDDLRDIVDFTVNDNQEVVMVTSSTEQPAELKILNLLTGQETSLYNPNQEYKQGHTYAQVSSFYYPSTDEKVQLQGWFTKAQGTNDKAPLILYIHGGPHAAYGDTFFHEFQALAAKGFHVVYFNPRGSTSYGEAFATDVMGHYGENDYDDVMAGLDYTLDHFDGINKDKIFIAGGSYGGFLSAWTISHTNRFQAAIVQRPAIDWIGLYTNSDIGVPFVEQEMGMDLYRDEGAAQYYWEKSPLSHANKVKTPVRIQHGELDRRCPVSQSEALFLAIKSTGTDSDYIRYPKSYHGLSRNGIPSLRVQRIEDIVEWFNRYI